MGTGFDAITNVPSFHLIVTSLYLGVEYLWWVLVFFVDSHSAVSCDIGVFVRGGELKSFYFTIFSPTPSNLTYINL